MLDLIIPVYKNIPGLYRSLFSIGTETNKQVYVTIVDDCSDDNYDEIIKIFQKFFPIRVIHSPENRGPGVARQIGLDNAIQPYVSFLDCGDTYTSPTRLIECLNTIKNNPEFCLFSWTHLEERQSDDGYVYNEVGPQNNRMHGKIYKREFLKQYNITFSAEGSRADEDIGFNIAARLTAETLWRKDNIQRVYHDNTPAVVWKVAGPSIVREDNCAFYYRDQNLGMFINGGHILDIARKNNVDKDLILREIYEEMVHMYIFYYATKNSRPEFLNQSIRGAAEYYINYFKPYGKDDINLLKDIYWDIVSSFLQDKNEPIRFEFSILDFPGFLNMLEQYCYDNNIVPREENNNTTQQCNNGFNFKEQ